MIFIIGGNSQGKLNFAKKLLHVQDENIMDGENCSFDQAFDKPVLNKLHLLIKRMTEAGADPWQMIMDGMNTNPSITVICDELSTGVIPVKREERAMQEKVGRIQSEIAARAEKVYRVYCSLPILIKGNEDGV